MANLALMRISGYHKAKGDNVDWHNPVLREKIDRVYGSKIFEFSPDYDYYPDTEIIKGGTGYDLKTQLPDEIERITKIDYDIYPSIKYSIQFFSRGCTRKCPFCVVNEKEGDIHPVDHTELNPRGEWIEVLDNHFFANPEWKAAAETLLKWKQPVNFHGIDVRTLEEEHCYYLNKIKRHKQIHIAWDNPKIDLVPKLKEVTKWIKPYKLMCYVLIGYWSTPEEDLHRVESLRGLGVDPFVMPFNKADEYQHRFARWVNHKAIFKSVKWTDYR